MSTGGIAFHNLASGSSANALLVREHGLTMLVDCGLPVRKLQSALAQVGATLDQIDLVFITHEHIDHVRALPQLMRRGATVMTSRGTARALRLSPSEFIPAVSGRRHDVAAVGITPRAVAHDASEPLGITVELSNTVITVLTDLGQVGDELIDAMSVSNVVVLEANHDVDMLRFGPYPAHLKRRVLSGVGHLSNADCGKALRSAIARSTSHERKLIWLAHLSETNNRPSTAATTVRQHIPGAHVTTLPRHDVVDLLAMNHVESQCSRPVQTSLWIDP
ncbi:MAG: MBL fold metallo-hydrolase [Thermomicrobiales bacterium]